MKNSKNSKRKYLLLNIFWLFLSACGGGGGGDGNPGVSDSYYKAMTEAYANEKLGEQGYDVNMMLVHEDGLGNSDRDVADINRVMMDRAGSGDLYIAYDAEIYSLGFSYLDPNVWAGSNVFSLFIDNDNDANTGKMINGIGADIKLSSLGQYIWNSDTSTWDSTWFESEPPYLGIHISYGGSYVVSQDINTGEAYIRMVKRIAYLDALVIDPNAKAVFQILYDILDESGFYTIEASLDTTTAFDLPNI